MVDLKKMKYGEFEGLCEKISESIKWYENTYKYNETTFLKLSNGDVMYIYFPRKSIAHLLGIDTEYLKCSKLFGEQSSYDLLNYVVSNVYQVNQKVNAGLLTYNSFISEYIDQKLEGFVSNTKIDFNSIEFICKFDKSRCVFCDGQVKIDYFIGQKIDEDIIALLGFVKDSDRDRYLPVTNQIIDITTDKGKSILEKYLQNQILMLPIFLRVDTMRDGFIINGNRYNDTILEIKNKFLNLKSNYAEKYNCIIDVSSAYDFELNKEHGILNAIVKITELLERDDKIEPSQLGRVPKELLRLVNKLNSLSLSPDGSAQLVLTLKEEIDKITASNNELIFENKSLVQERDDLLKQNAELNMDNNNLNNAVSQAHEIFKKVLKK